MKLLLWSLLFFFLCAPTTRGSTWDKCSLFRQEYDRLQEKKAAATKERDRLQIALRSELNQEIESEADGEQVDTENSKSSAIFYQLRKARLVVGRLEDEILRLRGNHCEPCVKEKSDCERCPDVKTCAKGRA